jgi:perosamine synthetase
VRPLYLQPLYQKRATHCSFNCEKYKGQVNYDKGLCPNAEKMHFEELFTHEFMRPGMTKNDLDDVITAFQKVYQYRDELK